MNTALAAWALVLNALVWGLSWWPFRELQQAGLHPLWATALIYGVTLAGLTLARPRLWGLLLRHPMLLALVLASGLTNVGFNWAVATGDVVRVVLLFYLMPAWSVLAAWALLGERPGLASLGRQGIALTGGEFENAPEYLFTRLNDVKPEMIQEATTKAREVAAKFAADSASSLGRIRTASQGQFTIEPRDKNNPHIKKVRVVSTVEYYLAD